jgi:hypothetical protein
MSLIGTAIGALVALLPRPTLDKADARFIAGYDAGLKDGRREAKDAQVEVQRLTRSHARLVDHIETLEREILLEQHICAHWKEEAERLAKHASASRLRAETLERDRQDVRYQALMAQAQNPLASQQAQQNIANQQFAQQAQQNIAMAQQQNLANYANQAQGLQWRGDYDGFCNCVPSRAQVWGADRGEG